MSSVPSIGIIGGGFVGSSIVKGFQHFTDVKVYDLMPEKSNASYEDTIEQDVLFVCVNTPMDADGNVNTDAVKTALESLQGNLPEGHTDKPVILKSTMPPDSIGEFMLEFSDEMVIIYSPEFLTERTSEYDFNQSNRWIFGSIQPTLGQGEGESINYAISLVKRLFKDRFPMVPQYWTTFGAASLVKYFTNVFFSVKVSMMNEFAQVCEAFDLNPEAVIGLLMLDQRIGRSHFKVPGHDGKRGFGGHCFPKDLNGYIHIAEEMGVPATMGKAAWQKNLEVRPEKDWENDKGRAVTQEKNDDTD
jgi:UDPglucose 6-dehydrogenase